MKFQFLKNGLCKLAASITQQHLESVLLLPSMVVVSNPESTPKNKSSPAHKSLAHE